MQSTERDMMELIHGLPKCLWWSTDDRATCVRHMRGDGSKRLAGAASGTLTQKRSVHLARESSLDSCNIVLLLEGAAIAPNNPKWSSRRARYLCMPFGVCAQCAFCFPRRWRCLMSRCV